MRGFCEVFWRPLYCDLPPEWRGCRHRRPKEFTTSLTVKLPSELVEILASFCETQRLLKCVVLSLVVRNVVRDMNVARDMGIIAMEEYARISRLRLPTEYDKVVTFAIDPRLLREFAQIATSLRTAQSILLAEGLLDLFNEYRSSNLSAELQTQIMLDEGPTYGSIVDRIEKIRHTLFLHQLEALLDAVEPDIPRMRQQARLREMVQLRLTEIMDSIRQHGRSVPAALLSRVQDLRRILGGDMNGP